jgi:O-antigen ligase
MHAHKLGRTRSSTRIIDKYAIVAIAAFSFSLIVSPVLTYLNADPPGVSLAAKLQSLMTPRLENKIVWPALAAISLFLAIRNWSKLTWPPHIVCLLAYLAFAGASVSWAFKPELSFIRFGLQVLILTSVVLPTMLAARTVDIMQGMFLCYAVASILNVFFVLNQTPIVADKVMIGYQGYFSFKGHLGECAAIAFLLSLHEILYPGRRRVLGIITCFIAIYLVFPSHSKGSFGIALIAPTFAGLALIASKTMRISPATVLVSISFCYAVLAGVRDHLINRISYHLYGNYTLSGRTFIWDFVNYEIARKPLFGWGFQSFWLVGLDAPGIGDAGTSWIGGMPSAHNGYLDTMLEMGYVGLALLVIFIIATLYAAGRVANREPARAWLLLSLALFVILTNFLETDWMRGADTMWLVFVLVAAEIGRYMRHFRPGAHRGVRRRGSVGARRRWGVVPAAASVSFTSRPRTG